MAVMVFAPIASEVLATEREQLPLESVQLPRLVLPSVNDTVPVGTEVGTEVFATVAVTLVELP